MTGKKIKYKDFESALARLEKINEKLESGELKLEDSIDLYTEGVEIAGFCNNKLSKAEKKIMILKEKKQGLTEEPFEEDMADGD